ncbi:uncharacterized protein LOC8067480 [Sorghum bicolor]|nr:uncharacterized protein LOC8067480 [Sorghum bicolor]|eukprot:XP_021302807.1 uncharacterized protein LOC8067480 [Sorghum bicolor]
MVSSETPSFPRLLLPSPTCTTCSLRPALHIYNTPSDLVPSISTIRPTRCLHSFFLSCTRKQSVSSFHYQELTKQMAATLKLRILTVAAAAAVIASSLVGTASAAEGPAPAPTSGASMAAPALAAASFTALVFGYLF